MVASVVLALAFGAVCGSAYSPGFSNSSTIASSLHPTTGGSAAPTAGGNATEAACYSTYNECRTSRPNGLSANMAACASAYATCLGFNPFNNDGTNTVTPAVSLSASSTTVPVVSSTASANSTEVDCYSKYNQCRTGKSANMASCAAEYAGCLGKNPFANNGTNTITPVAPAGSPVTSIPGGCNPAHPGSCPTYTTTEVVSTVTTFCPQPTTITIDKHVYTITKATTITVPVTQTITKPINSAASTASAYTTLVFVSAYTTFCPQPTTITVGTKILTVSTATTLTVPVTVTVTKPVESGAVTSAAATSSAYPCNPAHSYPNGAVCASTNGGLTLVTPTASAKNSGSCAPIYITVTETETVTVGAGVPVTTSIPGGCNPAHPGSCPSSYFSTMTTHTAYSNTSAPAATSAYACNPAHSYPNGAVCASTNGVLSLVTPTASASSTGYACNPAHSYPNGAACVSTNGALSLVTPTASASSTGYACNPAHSYPNGAVCVSTNGALSLVTPTASASSTGYACNPAHSYPNGAACVSTNGALSLVTPTASASSTGYACNPAHSYPNGAVCTSTNGALSLVTPAPSSSSAIVTRRSNRMMRA